MNDNAGAATPSEELREYIMSPTVAKNEAEHWARREIQTLTALIELAEVALKYYVKCYCEDCHRGVCDKCEALTKIADYKKGVKE